MIDPSDIFYLVAYLFSRSPPAGVAGMPSGDANGDGHVDPADIFYVVNYLFGGPGSACEKSTPVATSSIASRSPAPCASDAPCSVAIAGSFR